MAEHEHKTAAEMGAAAGALVRKELDDIEERLGTRINELEARLARIEKALGQALAGLASRSTDDDTPP